MHGRHNLFSFNTGFKMYFNIFLGSCNNKEADEDIDSITDEDTIHESEDEIGKFD